MKCEEASIDSLHALSFFSVKGLMKIINVTFGFFNDVCSRRDAAIRVSQDNDDGQHPVTTENIYYYNSSFANIIFNGRPNLHVVNPSDCVGKARSCCFLSLFFATLVRYGLRWFEEGSPHGYRWFPTRSTVIGLLSSRISLG